MAAGVLARCYMEPSKIGLSGMVVYGCQQLQENNAFHCMSLFLGS